MENKKENQPEGEFNTPLSKDSDLDEDKFKNIWSIIEDDDIEVTQLDQEDTKGESSNIHAAPAGVIEHKFDIGRLSSASEEQKSKTCSPQGSSPEQKQSQNSLKLNIMSNNFKPTKKVSKKSKLGNLKKPQSQKEPKLSNGRDFGLPQQQMYGGSHIVDNPHYIPNQRLMPDTWEDGSHSYNNIDRSTASSVGSANYSNEMAGYHPHYNQYPQPGYQMYPGNYYPQGYGMHGNQQMMHHPGHGHYPEYMQNSHGGHMYHPNPTSLHTISSGGSMASDTMSQGDSTLLKPGARKGKGFRKARSANEKSLPIDPNARELILKCDKEPVLANKLKILNGQISLLIYNQSGSRFLQNLLKKANNDVIEFFLKEIESDLYKLMMDKYGNYCCQELLQSCSGTQRLHILQQIQPNFLLICKDKKGTHAIQKLVDLATLDEEEKFFEGALKGEVAKLSIDQQGTHIIQKIILSFEEENRLFIFNEIIEGFMQVSKTSHGLCVIKKLISNTSAENRPTFIDFCRSKVTELMLDPYGNYALQEVMDKWPEQHFLPLISKGQDGLTCSVNKIAQLSIQKFSSNVVEKCIKMGNSEERNLIILNIAKISKLVSLMHSSFGNYVVQTALELSEGESLEALSESIYKNIPEISDKKIRTKWAKLLSDRLQTSQELASTYDLKEYLVEGIQALQPPKDREDPTMPSYPGYGHAQGKFQGHQTSPFKKPSPQPSPVSQPKSEESPGMNKGPSSYKTNRVEGKNHFQVFGAFTLKPQFNDSDDSD